MIIFIIFMTCAQVIKKNTFKSFFRCFTPFTKQIPNTFPPNYSEKKLQNSSLNPKQRAEQFPNNFYASDHVFICNFYQQNVDWNCVETCKEDFRSQARVENWDKHHAAVVPVPRGLRPLQHLRWHSALKHS